VKKDTAQQNDSLDPIQGTFILENHIKQDG